MPKEKDDQNTKEKTAKRKPFGSDGRVKSLSSAGQSSYYEASDFYANHYKNYIQFTSLIDGTSVKFKAFLTAFEDQFKSDWNSEQVYGRNDPIQTFRNTTRTINIGWDCPAGSIWEAKVNMANAALLIRMLYPGYRSTGNVSTINHAPLIKVKFRNLIKDYDGSSLMVTLDGINFSPDLESGFFDHDESLSVSVASSDELIPKLLKFSCNMTVLHKVTVGHNEGVDWSSELKSFPNLPSTLDVGEWSFGAESGNINAHQAAGQDAFLPENPDPGSVIAMAAAAEAEAEAQAEALDDAQSASSGDLEISNKQEKRKENKANRQDRKAKKTADKIKTSESAAWQAELQRRKIHGTGAQAADARDRQGLSYEGQKFRKRNK